MTWPDGYLYVRLSRACSPASLARAMLPVLAADYGWRPEAIERLATLRLTVHSQAQVVPVRHGIPWLGFLVCPEHRRVKARNVHNFRRRLRERWQEYCAGAISFVEFDASVQGWVNHTPACAGHTVVPAVKIKNRALRAQSKSGHMRFVHCWRMDTFLCGAVLREHPARWLQTAQLVPVR
jgi:hypothetical protein